VNNFLLLCMKEVGPGSLVGRLQAALTGMTGVECGSLYKLSSGLKKEVLKCKHRYVVETSPDCVWVAVSPQQRGRLHVLDSLNDPQDMTGFASEFQLGQSLRCYVLKVSSSSCQCFHN
jgi:hypothetical protein